MSLDISAAFDAVDHTILVQRLESEFGISGSCRQWISSYLTGRPSSVHVGSSASSLTMATSGVPQGSVLGPLLYVAYVAPAGRLISSFGIKFHQYADDTQLYTRLSTTDSASTEQLHQCTVSLQHWFWLSGLLLNPDKTSVTYFGTRARLKQSCLSPIVTVANTSVEVSDKLRVLGVTLDNCLSMDSHVNETVRNCNFHLQALRHIRPSVTREVANMIACSLVTSRMDYCNSLLHGVSETNLNKLQRTQNFAARIVCNVGRRDAPSRDLLVDLHWLPVRRRIEYKMSSMCYQAYRLHQPSYLSVHTTEYQPTRQLRSSTHELLNVPRHKTVLGSRRFSVAAPKIWNSLPLSIRTAETFKHFKSLLKTHLFRRSMD